ncbi:MAG: hypothetical protein HQ523_00015, partial [Lentisphaerae bacterium]|nr:hypothetical protein [Lentisphaerota bacterium]
MNARTVLIGLFVAVVFGFMLSATADVWCVATNGIDATGDGTWAAPFATIQKGIDTAAASGDTVLVSNGTYNISASVSIAKAVTVQSVNGPTNTIIRPSAGAFHVVSITAGNPVTLDGFTVRDSGSGGNGIYFLNSEGVVMMDVRIINCIITMNGGAGSAVGGIQSYLKTASGDKLLIRNCLV